MELNARPADASPIRCLVVDDEELARTLLAAYISRLPHLQLVGSCRDPLEANQALRKEAVDLIFLDIQMPELTGVEFMRSLERKPLVIFTTAYSTYALESYALDAVDYLLKPFDFGRFVHAVNKADELLRLRALEASQQVPVKDILLVKSDHKVHRLRIEDILYIQSMQEYVIFHTLHGTIRSLGSLKNLENDLSPQRFKRVHKSYIAAIPYIKSFDNDALQIGNDQIPVGQNYREDLMRRMFK